MKKLNNRDLWNISILCHKVGERISQSFSSDINLFQSWITLCMFIVSFRHCSAALPFIKNPIRNKFVEKKETFYLMLFLYVYFLLFLYVYFYVTFICIFYVICICIFFMFFMLWRFSITRDFFFSEVTLNNYIIIYKKVHSLILQLYFKIIFRSFKRL